MKKLRNFGAQFGLSTLFFAALLATNAHSEEGHDHGHEEGHNAPLAAHEHGHGALMVAQDGNDLLVELRLPGADVVGFEHMPENHEQEHAVEMAMENLHNASQWLRFTEEAQCRIEDTHVSSPLAGAMDDHGHDAHADEHAGHANEHAGEVHAEFLGEYRLHCDAPGQLRGVHVGLFQVFPTLEEIDFQAVVTQGQVGGKLDAEHTRVRF